LKSVIIIAIAVGVVIIVSSTIVHDQYLEWERQTFLEEQENKFNACVVKYGISTNIQKIEKFTDCVEGLTKEVQEFKESQGYSYSEDQQLENIEKDGTWINPFEEEDRMWINPFEEECKGIDQLDEYTLCVENAKYTP
tara:strand:- start:93 stop:506 length:414 start_codon:yes stop_codon:yes gene_type:complete